MAKVYTLFRSCTGPLGGMSHPVKTFDDKSVAEDACRKTVGAFSELVEGSIIVNTAGGPRKVMTVKQLLIELGVSTMSHNVLEQETHGALILAPTSAIIQ